MDLPNTKFLTTREASGLLGIAPDSMRTYLAKQGNVYGIEPVKSEANGRLMWPVAEVLNLLLPKGRGF